MPTGYAAHTVHYSIGAENKGPGTEIDKKRTYLQDEGQEVYSAISSTFGTGSVYINLLLIKRVASWLIRGYIKDRNLCFFT